MALSEEEAALDAAGFAADLGRKIDAAIYSGLLPHLHVILLARSGACLLERYLSGPDENWGGPLGNVSFGPETLHDLRSVTKSVVGLLYGIALDRGLVPPPDAPLLAQFPEYADLADPQRSRLTIEHALTMTLGMEWDEERPYTDPANSEIAMENARDRYRFVLDRPFVAEPGTRWIYSGGAVALIGGLIERGTGRTLPEFATEALFRPLGISQFEWASGRDGAASAASGLRLAARDLLRIGVMILDRGVGPEGRVVSEDWLTASLSPAIRTNEVLDYGRLWFLGSSWVSAVQGQRPWKAGFGNGGQRLWLMPDLGIAAVAYCGRYNDPEAWVTPGRIWREIILPGLHSA